MSRRIVFALGGLLALTGVSCGQPSIVEKVTIVNRIEYDVHAEVGDGRSGWLTLGDFQRESEGMIRQVIDFGERWVFRFGYRNLEQVEVSMTRADLAAAGWRAEVPASLAERLRTRGEPASYTGRR